MQDPVGEILLVWARACGGATNSAMGIRRQANQGSIRWIELGERQVAVMFMPALLSICGFFFETQIN
jgi:hypothetical protein